jgi:GTP-binding protein LepA
VHTIPRPEGDEHGKLRALMFSSVYDQHKGVIVYVRVVDGILKKQNLACYATSENFLPTELGIFAPDRRPVTELISGQVGYIASGVKDVKTLLVGDTICYPADGPSITPLPGYKHPQALVFLEFYPMDGDDYHALLDAMGKLTLHDAALEFQSTHSAALGNGVKVGFLGVLHAEIVQERLEREFNLSLIATAPTIPYEIVSRGSKPIETRTALITSPANMPDPEEIEQIREPITVTTIFTPEDYLGDVMHLCERHRAKLEDVQHFGARIRLQYFIPLVELIVNFHDELKSVSSGFASMEYELAGYEPVDAVKLDILVHHDVIDALSQIVVRSQAVQIGRLVVSKLKDIIPRQQFEVAIQAAIGSKVVARETISAYRKDVTAKLYGGDQTRKDKLLKKQKKGKLRMKELGKVHLPQEAFLAVVRRG